MRHSVTDLKAVEITSVESSVTVFFTVCSFGVTTEDGTLSLRSVVPPCWLWYSEPAAAAASLATEIYAAAMDVSLASPSAEGWLKQRPDPSSADCDTSPLSHITPPLSLCMHMSSHACTERVLSNCLFL